METACEDPLLECQICFHGYSPRRRPKQLACRHTCCSHCLAQLGRGREVRCPWCRALTRLPPGVSPAQLPDDPHVVAATALPRAPVFVRLAGAAPPPPGDARTASHFLPGGRHKAVAVVMVPERPLPSAPESGEGEGRGSTCSGVCTVLLVACVLLFLLGIVLHNMSCISRRFTVISCG